MPESRDDILAKLAIDGGLLTAEQVDEARATQKRAREELGLDETLGHILVSRKYLTQKQCDEIEGQVAVQTGEVRRFGAYEVVEKLGEGGFGGVYKARHVETGGLVALKILPPSLADGHLVARFKRESRLVQSLACDNIVGWVDFGLDEKHSCYYCALELIEGEDLQKRIARLGCLDEDEALAIASDIANALAHASAKGLVHRDVKPSNIMVTPGGRAKLLDLGLAKPQAETDGVRTRDGLFVGTVSYASPEQAKGQRDLDVRSDIYALGATLYHMLTGTPPFEADTELDVMEKHVKAVPHAPRAVRTDISEGASLVTMKMLEKDPAKRYQNADRLMDDIAAARAGGGDLLMRLRGQVTLRATRFEPAVGRASPRPSPRPGGGGDRKRSGLRPRARKTTHMTAAAAGRRGGGGAVIVGVLVLAAAAVGILVVASGGDGQRMAVGNGGQRTDAGDGETSGAALATAARRPEALPDDEHGDAAPAAAEEPVTTATTAADGTGRPGTVAAATAATDGSGGQGTAATDGNGGQPMATAATDGTGGPGTASDPLPSVADSHPLPSAAETAAAEEALAAFDDLLVRGAHAGAERVAADLRERIAAGADAPGLAAAARIAGVLAELPRAAKRGAHALVGKKVRLRLTTGHVAGDLAAIVETHMIVVTTFTINRETKRRDVDVRFSALHPEQLRELAVSAGWTVAEGDRRIMRAYASVGARDLDAAAEELAAAGDHDLAAHVRGLLERARAEFAYDEAIDRARGHAGARRWKGALEAAEAALAVRPGDEEATGIAADARRHIEPAPRVTIGLGPTASIELIYVRPGSFMMGSGASVEDARPARLVTLTKGFYIGKYEVTQLQYEAVMNENPSKHDDDPRVPAERVSWNDARRFCEKASALTGKRFRLPTEAEWEYAARAGTTGRWYFGDNERLLEDHAWYRENSGRDPHPVGQLRANPWGLHDVYGNVAEHVSDWYDDEYYRTAPPRDPPGPPTGTRHVVRGGSWYWREDMCTSAHRGAPDYQPDDSDNGFRIVVDVE